nr:NAD(P)H-dependent oxidoreductase [Rhizobium daejeonense]
MQGHPDTSEQHFCHALADAYAAGALKAGHTVERLEIARIEVPRLQSQKEQESSAVVPDIANAQTLLKAADHVELVFPLWMGGMPSLVASFLEQVLRPGYAYDGTGPAMKKLLRGRSMRLVYGSHSLKAWKVGALGFVGFRPIRASLVGNVAEADVSAHTNWLKEMEALGAGAR